MSSKEDLKKHEEGTLTNEELDLVAGGKGDPVTPDHAAEYAVGDYSKKDLGNGIAFMYLKILAVNSSGNKWIYTIVHNFHDYGTGENKTYGVDSNWEEGMFGWNGFSKCDSSECSNFFVGY